MESICTIGVAISPRKTGFGAVVFSGRLDDGLEAASKAKFDVVELSIRSVDDVNPVELTPKLNDLNLKISAIATGQACLFDSLCLGSDDPGIRLRAVEHFKAITNLAVNLGAGAVIIGGIRGRLSGTGDQYKKAYDTGVNTIRECAQWPDSRGITLLVEPINRYETNWIYTAKDGLALLDEIGINSVKLLLDTFHMNIEEASISAAIELANNRLGYVHFADNTRHAPGQGQTDFKSILKALKKINYLGPIVAEILPLPDDLTALKNTAEFWEKIAGED